MKKPVQPRMDGRTKKESAESYRELERKILEENRRADERKVTPTSFSKSAFHKTTCRHCGVHVEYPSEAEGQPTQCPKCGEDVILVVLPKGGANRERTAMKQVLQNGVTATGQKSPQTVIHEAEKPAPVAGLYFPIKNPISKYVIKLLGLPVRVLLKVIVVCLALGLFSFIQINRANPSFLWLVLFVICVVVFFVCVLIGNRNEDFSYSDWGKRRIHANDEQTYSPSAGFSGSGQGATAQPNKESTPLSIVFWIYIGLAMFCTIGNMIKDGADEIIKTPIAFIFIGLSLALYFLPSYIAYEKNKKNAGAVFALNLLTGWTVIGWVISLVWALAND